MDYGFRLFTASLRQGHGQAAFNFTTTCGSADANYLDYATPLLQDLKEGWVAAASAPDDAVDDAMAKLLEEAAEGADMPATEQPSLKGKPLVKVDSVQRPDDRLMVVTFKYGRVSSHDEATGVRGRAEDVPLTDRAPTNLFRAVVLLPTAGDEGLVAVEAIGRSCPQLHFSSALLQTAKTAATSMDADGTKKVGTWWRLMLSPLVDIEHLERVMALHGRTSMELVKKEILPDRQRDKTTLKITAPELEMGQIERLKEVVRGWVSDRGKGKAVDERQGARQLAAVLGGPIEDLNVNDGLVVFGGDDQRPLKIRPSHIDDIFTYLQPKSERVASDSDFYRLVQERARRIERAAKLQLDWPVWTD